MGYWKYIIKKHTKAIIQIYNENKIVISSGAISLFIIFLIFINTVRYLLVGSYIFDGITTFILVILVPVITLTGISIEVIWNSYKKYLKNQTKR